MPERYRSNRRRDADGALDGPEPGTRVTAALAGVRRPSDVLLVHDAVLPNGLSFRVQVPEAHDLFGDRGGDGLPDDALLLRSVVEQCAYATLQSTGLLRPGEVPLNTSSSSRVLTDPPLPLLPGGLLATCLVQELRTSRTGRTRRVVASCVLRSPDGRTVADGETDAGVLENVLYRNWRGAGVVRAGHLPPVPNTPYAHVARVRSRPDNQVLSQVEREEASGAHAVLRLSGPHPYLLPASADHVTGRLFAEATRQLIIGVWAPNGGMRSLHLSFPRLCTLATPVLVQAITCAGPKVPAQWHVLFSQRGVTVCAGHVEAGV
ncbi:AfsA-related hotdog domain-containing protein [Streptomyces griseus]|uniref:AfsA-related hotdog domain-containing protein n=1 Tax=Streptomyces griseus TaxID=1911 RepID=UPI000D13BB12|nr:AfsA-related hotdog domain-containing protein [Streptomyces griseus]